MATWPSTLPAPQRAGYGVTPINQSLRTDMESGAARSRRQTYARNDRVSVSWIFTDAQFDVFRTWFENDAEAAGGSAWFSINLRVGNTGSTAQSARFVGAYQAQQQGINVWSVSASIEVRDA